MDVDAAPLQVTLGRNLFVAHPDVKPEELIGAAVKEGLERRGYATNTNKDNAKSVVIHVRQFALHNQMGMWSMSVLANITATIDYTIDGRTGSMTVKGAGKNVCQFANAANMELAMQRAVGDFLQNFDREAATAGF